MEHLVAFLVPFCFIYLTALVFYGQLVLLRLLSLSLIASISVAAYVAWLVAASFSDAAPYTVLIAAISIGALSGSICGVVDWFFSGISRGACLVASFGLLTFVQGVLVFASGGGIFSFRLGFDPLILDLNADLSWMPHLLICLFLSSAVIYLLFWRSRLGLVATAVGDNRQAAELYGVPVLETIVLVEVVGGAFGGMLGAFYAAENGVRPDVGFVVALKGIAVLLVAGSNLKLILATVFVIAGLETFFGYWFGGQVQELVGLGVLSGLLLLKLVVFGRVG